MFRLRYSTLRSTFSFHTPSQLGVPRILRSNTVLRFHSTRVPGAPFDDDSILSRFRKSPKLGRKPGVPGPHTASLRNMMDILYHKRGRELIYEAESHHNWFRGCAAIAVVFAFYGLTFLDWSFSSISYLYKEDGDLREYYKRLALNLAASTIPFGLVALAIWTPTRLVRRIYFDPTKKAVTLVRYAILDSENEVTIPLAHIMKSSKRKIFTSSGEYGTIENATFSFLLKDDRHGMERFLVDRAGWYWGDGRVLDVLFGKESLDSAEIDQTLLDRKRSSKLKKDQKKQTSEDIELKKEFIDAENITKADIDKVTQIVSSLKKKKKQ